MKSKYYLYKTAQIATNVNIWDEMAQKGCFVKLTHYEENDGYWIETISGNKYYCPLEHLTAFCL